MSDAVVGWVVDNAEALYVIGAMVVAVLLLGWRAGQRFTRLEDDQRAATKSRHGLHKDIEALDEKITRVERRGCAHMSVLARHLKIPYDEVLAAEREAGITEPKGT